VGESKRVCGAESNCKGHAMGTEGLRRGDGAREEEAGALASDQRFGSSTMRCNKAIDDGLRNHYYKIIM
jgi:hypothetical protein